MKNKNMIPSAGPSITEKEVAYVLEAVKFGWYERRSAFIEKFERAFAEYIGVKHAIATSSCTGAMHLALAALKITAGDEVIIPEITWVQTAAVVTYVGAKPVFADIDKETWTMDPNSLKKAINKATKAIIPVHLYGHPANMEEIQKIAAEHGLFVLEDAAPSIGSEYKGKKTGGMGDFGAFSFQGAKMMVTGEGGMLVTNNDNLYERASFLSEQGRDNVVPFWVNEIGLKYKMSNVQAALGLAQLERVDELIDKRRKIYEWYKKRLGRVEGLVLSEEKEWAKCNHWMTSILLKKDQPISRNDLITKLYEKGIDTRRIFPAMSNFPMFIKANNPVAEMVGANGLNLPSAFDLSEKDVNYVCDNLINLLKETKQ